ncbi:MAG: RsmB/NOP family class I SAM-dependent RNA methyltransferase [Clostridia bacterium]|nr:RsmB/NOP family class I SAM-dependent RNA methyltransferase [Clostridia bacterium]
MNDLPKEFLSRMKSSLSDFDGFLKSYTLPPEKAIRINTLKIAVEDFKKISPFDLEPVPWESSAFYVSAESPGKTVHHAAGLYYVQEPSAAVAAPKLAVERGERVLDLCSAPGGKGTQLAQYLGGEGVIFLNEINFSRAKILCSNVERMGVKNAVITCAPPQTMSECFEGYFDKILVDAPCSGEGMFKKEEAAIPEWSLENVNLCAARQKDILACAHKMLKGGGRMVYSTCTFAPEEDERQVESFLYLHPDCRLIEMQKLLPHEIRGEGHFFAVIEKDGGIRRDLPLLAPFVKDKKLISIYREWESCTLSTRYCNLHAVGDTLYSLPDEMPEISVQTLRAGVRLGEFAKDRFIPSHSLAMCLKKGEAGFIELDEQTAIKYLRGQTFDCDNALKGWHIAAFCGFPLGWCKASGGVAKNHLPKGLRI